MLNFLPLPPFDGGLTVLLLIEKIKGSAISVRTQEIIAYAGWGMILIAYAVCDIQRYMADYFWIFQLTITIKDSFINQKGFWKRR